MSYAAETSVSVERTRAEIESILSRYGATRFAYATEERRAVIMFVINKTGVRFELPLPQQNERRFTHTPSRGKPRPAAEAYREWEQGCRSLWRSLFLCIKAKLEACDAKITTFEAEFLAHVIMQDGRTVGEMAIPQLLEMRENGTPPRLQLEWNGNKQ